MIELASLRTEFSRTYELDTGVRRTVACTGPLNYKSDPDDDNSPYLPINTAITASALPNWDGEVSAGMYRLLLKTDTTVALGREGNWVGFRFDGFGYLDWTTKQYEILQTRQAVAPAVTGNKVRWENICPHVNLEYIYGPKGFKENIEITQAARDWLVAHPPSSYGMDNSTSYLVGYSLCDWSGAYSAETHEGTAIDWDAANDFTVGNIIWNHPVKQKILAFLPLGHAFIAGHEEISVTMRQRFIKVGSDYRVLFGAKVTDLNSLAAGTIILDPSTVFQPDSTDGKDAPIYGYDGNDSGGDPPNVQTRQYGAAVHLGFRRTLASPFEPIRSLCSFNLSALGDIYVHSATYSLYLFSNDGPASNVRIYRTARSDWEEGTGIGAPNQDPPPGVTWRNVSGGPWPAGVMWDSYGGDYDPSWYVEGVAPAAGNWQDWIVTDLVQDAVDHRGGLVETFLRATTETATGYYTWAYYSSDYVTDPSLIPKLTVDYSVRSRGGYHRRRILINKPAIRAGIRSYL